MIKITPLLTGVAVLSMSFISVKASADTIVPYPVDSVKVEKTGLIKRIIKYFDETNKKPIGRKMDFSFIGGPMYSSDEKFGVGLVAAGAYNTCPEDSITQVSNISLTFKATTALHFSVGLEGEHIFPHDKYRLTYTGEFSSIKTKYWGIGYDMDSNDENESDFKYFASRAEAIFGVRVGNGLYVGPLLTLDYVSARHYSNPELWIGQPASTFNYGVGVSLRYDTRDNLTAPRRGIFLRLDQSFDWGWMGNRHPFSVNELTAAWYGPLWKSATLATRLHWRVTWGDTPWGLMSTIGGSTTMRGYFEGRYRDKGAADVCVELRQHVWRRNGLVAWVGVGSVFPRLSDIEFRQLLPNYGIGYRWEFKKNVNVRLDLGFGKHESGIFFNINEAF